MDRIADFRNAATAVAFAVVVGSLPACGGSEGTGTSPGSQAGPEKALEGARVSDRDAALQLVARGVVAPLYFSELAHAVLAHAVLMRATVHRDARPLSDGDAWLLTLNAESLGAGATLDGPVTIDIEAAHNVEGLMLRGEPGFVRSVLRFERVALGAAAFVDGVMTLEVSRTSSAAGAARRSQADALSMADASGTLRWSYLDVAVDAHKLVQRLTVVSDVPVNAAGPVWLDATSSAPGRLASTRAGTALSSGRYVASGVIGFLKARLMLQVAADGGWTIDIDNDKDDHVDFVVRASADEVRALMPGL